MQVSNPLIVSSQTTDQHKNNQFKVAESGVDNKVKNIVQAPLKPIRSLKKDENIQQRERRFTAENKINMELKTPKKNGISKNGQVKNNPQNVAKNQGETLRPKEQAKILEQISESNCTIGPSDEEKMLLRIAAEIVENKASNNYIAMTDEEISELDFSDICKKFSFVSQSHVAVKKLEINNVETKVEKTQVVKTSPEVQKKLDAIQKISDKTLEISNSTLQNQCFQKLNFEATNDSFISLAFSISSCQFVFLVDQNLMKQIRFSQKTVSDKMTSGESLEAFQQKLEREKFKVEGAIIIVLMPDNTYTSFDNRRLLSSLIVADKCKDFKIFVDVKHYNDVPDASTLNHNRNVFANTWKYYFHQGDNKNQYYGVYGGVKPGTCGELIQMRVVLYSEKVFPGMRNGYNSRPEVRSPTEKRRF